MSDRLPKAATPEHRPEPDVESRALRVVRSANGNRNVTDGSRFGDDPWRDLLGPLLDAQRVRTLMKLRGRSTVRELVESKQLLGLPTDEGDDVYPSFQFQSDGTVIPALPRILKVFDGVVATPYTIASWLRSPKEPLDGLTPLQWLEHGRDPDRVVIVAELTAAQLAR